MNVKWWSEVGASEAVESQNWMVSASQSVGEWRRRAGEPRSAGASHIPGPTFTSTCMAPSSPSFMPLSAPFTESTSFPLARDKSTQFSELNFVSDK